MKSFFDIGSSDLLIEFATLISKVEYEALARAVLATGRQNRIVLILAFIVIFSVVMSRITRRIEGLTKRVSEFSEKKLGGPARGLSRGDQLIFSTRTSAPHPGSDLLCRETRRRAMSLKRWKSVPGTQEARNGTGCFSAALMRAYGPLIRTDSLPSSMQMANMVGYPIEEMMGKSIFFFMDERGREMTKRIEDRRREGIAAQVEQEFIRKDGARIYTIAETSSIMDGQGNYAGAIWGIIDITERKKMEATIAHQAHHDILTGLANKALFMTI
jgi:PAS domain S-box-containing protein